MLDCGLCSWCMCTMSIILLWLIISWKSVSLPSISHKEQIWFPFTVAALIYLLLNISCPLFRYHVLFMSLFYDCIYDLQEQGGHIKLMLMLRLHRLGESDRHRGSWNCSQSWFLIAFYMHRDVPLRCYSFLDLYFAVIVLLVLYFCSFHKIVFLRHQAALEFLLLNKKKVKHCMQILIWSVNKSSAMSIEGKQFWIK